jgi:hypothetical protein
MCNCRVKTVWNLLYDSQFCIYCAIFGTKIIKLSYCTEHRYFCTFELHWHIWTVWHNGYLVFYWILDCGSACTLYCKNFIWVYLMIYLLPAIGLSPGGCRYSTHLHTNNTQNNKNNNRITPITVEVLTCL